MPATIYYDNDADLSVLKGKTIAILGYGSQGHAQAQNLRDSGCNVVIGQRKGGKNYDLAVEHGFKPMSAADATKAGDLVNILVPDEIQGDLYRNEVRPNRRSLLSSLRWQPTAQGPRGVLPSRLCPPPCVVWRPLRRFAPPPSGGGRGMEIQSTNSSTSTASGSSVYPRLRIASIVVAGIS